jgi:hypothetical protein
MLCEYIDVMERIVLISDVEEVLWIGFASTPLVSFFFKIFKEQLAPAPQIPTSYVRSTAHFGHKIDWTGLISVSKENVAKQW